MWRDLGAYVNNVKHLIIQHIDMTSKVVIGEWPLPLPQFLFFSKKDLENPIPVNLPNKIEKFTDFLKNNSIEF